MKTHLTFPVFAIGLALALFSPEALADRRIFGFTYTARTPAEGSIEVEHYLDAGLNRWDDPATSNQEREWTRVDWRHQLELEIGLTDRLDLGLYNVFRQRPYEDFSYDGLKLRSRVRFSDPGDLWIDPALYLEVGFFGSEMVLEQMLILSKNIGSIELAFNARLEQVRNLEEGEWELEFLPLVGIGIHLSESLALALEIQGKLEVEDGETEGLSFFTGPAISWARGSFFWTLAVQAQLGQRPEIAAVQFRSLLGIQL